MYYQLNRHHQRQSLKGNTMSFIYDDNQLLEKLLVSGINSVVKQAQNKPAAPPAPADYAAYHVADALNVQLQRQLGVPGAPSKGAPLGVAPGAPAAPTADPSNLRTLGDFILWCANKQLTWEGQRFAWAPNEAHPTQAEDPDIWDFESMRDDRARDELTRKPIRVPAVANVKSLTEFLVYLRDSEKNQITRLMISKLVGELNTFLVTGNKQPIDAVSKPEAKSSFDDSDIVDGFTSNVLGAGDIFDGTSGFPFFEKAPKKLTYGDIKSEGAFKAWLRTMTVAMPDKSTVTADKPESDAPCIAVNVLFRRARQLNQFASSADKVKANYSKLTELYVKVVTEYGSKLTGANGKACAVTTAGTTSETQSGTNTSNTSGNKKYDPMVMNKVVMSLPLRVETLDFDRIDQFFREYAKLNPEVEQWHAPATTYMDAASNLTIHNDKNFNLQIGAQDILASLKPPQINQGSPYVPFLNQLKGVLDMVGQALQDLKKRYADSESGESMITDPTQLSRINAQILGTSSIWSSNNRVINTLLSQVSATQSNYSGKNKFNF
jgi:hypothetical protein